MITILNQMAEKWYGWELAMLWQAGLLIAIVAAIDLLIKKWAWPQVRYALWMLILVKLVLPPGLTSPTSFTAEIPIVIKQTLTNTDYNTNRHGTENTGLRTQNAELELPKTGIQNSKMDSRFRGNDKGEVLILETKNALSWKGYLMFVWAGGMAILAGWLVIRLHGLRREHLKDELQIDMPERLEGLLAATGRKMNLRRIPQVILTDKVCCPAVFGVFRPVLLMPADKLQNMTAQDAENIFLHELAHIKRGDLLVHAIYMILQIAYWFNPLIWLIRKHLQNLRELCCDATVARMLKEKTAGYRQTLLETARELLAVPVDPGLGLLGLFENSSWLLDRLRWLEKKSWKYRPLRIATVFILICLMSACVLPMTKFQAPADFVIKGTVTDAETGKPIAGAKVGDVNNYADGKYCTITDANGDYSYKTWYEEHGIKAITDGYKEQRKGLLTKFFGSEKEKVIDFQLKANEARKRLSPDKSESARGLENGTSEDVPPGKTTDPAQIKNIMITMGGIFHAARTAIQSPGGGADSGAKIMEDALPQFEKFELAIQGTNISDSVHLIIEQIRQAIKANKDGDSARAAALIAASDESWNQLINEVVNEIRKKEQEGRYKEAMQKMEKDSERPAGQDKQEEIKKSEFEQLLHKPVTLDISKSPDSNRLTVQYAVINVCEAAGIPYQWGKSAKLADPERRNYIEPVHIKGKFVSEAINDILNPFGLSYGLDANGLYLYRSDLQKPVRPYFPVAIAQIARDLLQEGIKLHQLKAQNASQAEINEVENRIEALGETMDEVCNDLGKKMEVSGEQLAKKIAALAEKVDEKNGEQFAERIVKEIEAWGEKFSEQFKEQFDRQIKSAGLITDEDSKKSNTDTNVKKARALRVTIYEGNDIEPQTSVRMPLVAMKIVRQLLPSKDKLQIIAQKIKLDENLPQDMNSTTLIDMLDDMLKKLDEGVESTTLLEVKDGEERIIIALE